MAGPAAGFRFPIDSVMAPGYVRKAGKAEQALARTEEVVSSADVEPMGYPICRGERPRCLCLQTLFEILSACKNIRCRKTMLFPFRFSSRISSCSKLSSRHQPVAAHHLAAKGASPEVLPMSLLTDTAIPIFIFMDLFQGVQQQSLPNFLTKSHPGLANNLCAPLQSPQVFITRYVPLQKCVTTISKRPAKISFSIQFQY